MWWWFALAGCLPKQSLEHADQLQAQVWSLEGSFEASAGEQRLLWPLHGEIHTRFARTFRDGSLGFLVLFPSLSAPDPLPLSTAAVELRTFPNGQILDVVGASSGYGAGRLDALDWIWPVLSPEIPERSERELRAGVQEYSSWPTWLGTKPVFLNRATLTWTWVGQDGPLTTLRYEGTLTSSDPRWRYDGALSGEVTLHQRAHQLTRHTFQGRRTIPASGGAPAESQAWSGTLAWVGAAPVVNIENQPLADHPILDAQPLQLADGRVVTNEPLPVVPSLRALSPAP